MSPPSQTILLSSSPSHLCSLSQSLCFYPPFSISSVFLYHSTYLLSIAESQISLKHGGLRQSFYHLMQLLQKLQSVCCWGCGIPLDPLPSSLPVWQVNANSWQEDSNPQHVDLLRAAGASSSYSSSVLPKVSDPRDKKSQFFFMSQSEKLSTITC